MLYRYNSRWTRSLQDAIVTVVICGWLGGMSSESRPGELGRLLTIEEVGELFQRRTRIIHMTFVYMADPAIQSRSI